MPQVVYLPQIVEAAQARVANAHGVTSAAGTMAVLHLFVSGSTPMVRMSYLVDGVSAATSGSGLSAAECSLISIGAYLGPAQYNDLSIAMLRMLPDVVRLG
jgi:hypothetical protein